MEKIKITGNEFVTKTSLSGLLLIDRPIRYDNRGFFREAARMSDLKDAGIDFSPVQVNHSLSEPNVIRALHAEQWNKLVYPITGEIFIAIVDIRPESETFGKFETFSLNDKNRKLLYIPVGFANSICVAGDEPVNYVYLVDQYYTGQDTRAIAWDDPDLNIPWPVKNPIISERDKNNPTLRQLFPDKFK